MKFVALCGILLCFALSGSTEKARFDKYRVFSIEIKNKLQLEVLKELEATSDSYNFWESPGKIPSNVEIVVAPHMFANFAEIVEKFHFKTTLIIENLQNVIDKESSRKPRKLALGEMDWLDYHSTEEIHAWLDTLKAEFPDFITIETIGETFERRPLKLVKLSKKQNNRAIFIEANIHAREWIASATATFVLNELLYSTNPEIQEIALNVDWYIIPVLNADGYEYSRTTNRNWRKTRRPSSLVCFGIDGNRNFEYNWLIKDETGSEGASRAPCSDLYAGPQPFSEPETIALNNYLAANYQKFDVYLSFHSYAHQILFPWGHSRQRIQNYDENKAVGDAAAARLFAKNGIEYEVGSTIEVLYAASGVSVDHAYGYYGIPIGYTFEMRGNGDYGRFGFFLPPEFIIPNAEEIVEALIGLVHKAREFNYVPVSN